MKIFEQLKKIEISDTAYVRNYQKEKLFKTLDVSFTKIPYYNNFQKLEFPLCYQDFLKIPIITKDIIRQNERELINKSYKKIKEVSNYSSGGSTGEPLQFYRTKNHTEHSRANYFYANFLNKVNLYDGSIELWGAQRDMHHPQNQFDIKAFLNNYRLLNTFVLSDAIIEKYIQEIIKRKPKFLKAYVHSLYDIARYINKNGIKIDFKPIIHCSAGPLYPEMRSEIKRAFNDTNVFDYYGSREVGAIATEVYQMHGRYVLFDNVFVEILDENDQPVKKGEAGEIVVTTLNNFYMPLLRYRIGDRAVKGDDLEFGTLRLGDILGRTLGVIHTKDGRKIDGGFFTSLFDKNRGIKKFQLVQKSISKLSLNLIKDKDFHPNDLDPILSRIKKEVPDVEINVNYCDEINLTSTGKIMYVYSEINSK